MMDNNNAPLHTQGVMWARDAALEERIKSQHSLAHQKRGILPLIFVAYSTLGVVFGDIGTSPLYVYASVFPDGAPADTNHILGAFSMIFWTITVVVLMKYVLIMLYADDNGEGGIIALYSLIARAANVRTVADAQATELGLTGLTESATTISGRSRPTTRMSVYFRNWLRSSKARQFYLLLTTLVAVNLIISDGVLTPAISVISAVEGIKNQTSLSDQAVIGITIGILILLFTAQSFGTAKVSGAFSPVIITWFIALAGIGIYNIISYDGTVFKGLSPHYIYYYWSGDSYEAWKRLGAVMLSITGAEALYADLGHFNAASIRLSFLAIVYPSLTLTYLGQTAMLLHKPELAPTAFWAAVPNAIFWPMVVLATLAAIIASQALITGSFSIVYQGIAMAFFPKITVKHTSSHHMGQIYMPAVNWLLLLGCIIVVVILENSINIGNAYGLAIILVMLIDTALLSLVMIMYWNWPWYCTLPFFSIYTFISGAYFSSTLEKVPKGAWFSLVIASVLTILAYIYHLGHTMKESHMETATVPFTDLFETFSPDTTATTSRQHKRRASVDSIGSQETEGTTVTLTQDLQDLRLIGTKLPISRVPGIGIYYSGSLAGIGPVLTHFLTLTPAIHEVAIFLTVRQVPIPHVYQSERLLVRKLVFKGFYQVCCRYGYLDVINHDDEFYKNLMTELLEYLHPDTRLEDLSEIGDDNQDTVMSFSEIQDGGVAVDLDPTVSLASKSGRRLLREISQRLERQSVNDTVTSGISQISRTSTNSGDREGLNAQSNRVMLAFPAYNLQRNNTITPSAAAPWVQQPSVLRRVRTQALNRALTDATATTPLPAPPPRPAIYRLSAPYGPVGGGKTPVARSRESSVRGGSVSITIPEEPQQKPATLLLRGRSAASFAAELHSVMHHNNADVSHTTARPPVTVSAIPTSQQTKDTAADLLQALQQRSIAIPADSEQRLLVSAYEHGLVYLVGRSVIDAHTQRSRLGGKIKCFVVNKLYNAIIHNSRSATAQYKLSSDNLLEVKVVYKVHVD